MIHHRVYRYTPFCKGVSVHPSKGVSLHPIFYCVVSRLKSDKWNSWLRQYLRTPHERNRWIQPRPPLKKGDLVFIKDEKLKGRTWPIARFLDTFPGDDGQVRAVRLLCRGKQYTRATQLLIPFCLDDQDTK